MRKAAIRAVLSRSAVAGSALGRGIDAAGQLGGAASELVRVRKDPSAVAFRRQQVARRRVRNQTVGAAIGAAGTAGCVVDIVRTGFEPGVVAAGVLLLALLIWSVLALIAGIRELGIRNRVVDSLPPPQPRRQSVARIIKPEMARLAGQSDAIRQLISMIGARPDAATLELRTEVAVAADAAEVRIRAQAMQLTALLRAQRNSTDASVTGLVEQIRAGVAEYGRLVEAAGQTVAASTALLPADDSMAIATARLQGLAIGMRELSAS